MASVSELMTIGRSSMDLYDAQIEHGGAKLEEALGCMKPVLEEVKLARASYKTSKERQRAD